MRYQKYIYEDRVNMQEHKSMARSNIYLLYQGHRRKFLALILTLHPLGLLAPHYSVLPYALLEYSSHSFHSAIGADDIHWLAA
jgi:hypothetical protein